MQPPPPHATRASTPSRHPLLPVSPPPPPRPCPSRPFQASGASRGCVSRGCVSRGCASRGCASRGYCLRLGCACPDNTWHVHVRQSGVGVSRSRSSRLAAGVKANGGNGKMGGEWGEMEGNGGEWGIVRNCQKYVAGNVEKCVKFVGNGRRVGTTWDKCNIGPCPIFPIFPQPCHLSLRCL